MKKHLQLDHKILNDIEICSRILCKVITEDKIQLSLTKWNSFNNNIKDLNIHCDSMNFNTSVENISITEYGYAKDNKELPQINMTLSLKSDDHLPLYYDLYNGSIIDFVECDRFILKMHKLGYKNIVLIFDRGYFFESNIRGLDCMSYNFIIMMRKNQKFVKELIDENSNKIRDNIDSYIGEFFKWDNRKKRIIWKK